MPTHAQPFGVAFAAFDADHPHLRMVHPQPRTRFNSPRLIRMLSALGGSACGVGADESVFFAERISHWIALTAAIGLSHSLAAGARAPAPAGKVDLAAALQKLQAPFARQRESLMSAATGAGTLGRGRLRLPGVPTGAFDVKDVDFTPYRLFYLAQQRDMEANVGVLRTAARDVLAGLPTAARALREIDAALQVAIAERERALLAAIPRLLECRFETLRDAASASETDDNATWMQPGGWLATFRSELLALLEAELELRLQPVIGLMETLEHEIAATGAHATHDGHAQ